MTVQYKPEGYHTVTPYLAIAGAAQLLAFLTEAFDGQEIEKLMREDGTINHAEVRIGDSIVMLGDPVNEADASPGLLYLYVPDTDETYEKALSAGATSIMEPADQYYGDRNATVKDPTGNVWYIATHVEDVPPDELQRRAAQAAGQ